MSRVAVVTGGGRGIGKGITESLLKANFKVLIAQRKAVEAPLSENPSVKWVEADLSERDAVTIIADAADQFFGGADTLINNAGIMYERPLEEMNVEEWDTMMSINLRAPVFLAKALLPQMRRKGAGCIVNIGSIEGEAANPFHVAYCASKAGVHGFTRALSVDLGRYNIRCNAIAPGWIDSDLNKNYIQGQNEPDQAMRELIKQHPVGRTGSPQDIGNAVVFLASDTASFITGQVITVDGGRTAKLPMPF